MEVVRSRVPCWERLLVRHRGSAIDDEGFLLRPTCEATRPTKTDAVIRSVVFQRPVHQTFLRPGRVS